MQSQGPGSAAQPPLSSFAQHIYVCCECSHLYMQTRGRVWGPSIQEAVRQMDRGLVAHQVYMPGLYA